VQSSNKQELILALRIMGSSDLGLKGLDGSVVLSASLRYHRPPSWATKLKDGPPYIYIWVLIRQGEPKYLRAVVRQKVR
jgi:hypothetical protein